MPTTKEFTIHLEDRPGTLARVCGTLADYNVNIVAFQAARAEGSGHVRFWWTTHPRPGKSWTMKA
jgi:acetolactate synthase small subunit